MARQMAAGDSPAASAFLIIEAFWAGVQLTLICAVVLRFWLPLLISGFPAGRPPLSCRLLCVPPAGGASTRPEGGSSWGRGAKAPLRSMGAQPSCRSMAAHAWSIGVQGESEVSHGLEVHGGHEGSPGRSRRRNSGQVAGGGNTSRSEVQKAKRAWEGPRGT